MESDPLKSSPPPADAFASLLRAQAALPPLADDGFSRRVLVTLPPVRQRHSLRGWVAIAGLFGGMILMLTVAGLTTDVPHTLFAFNTELVDAVNQLLTPAGSGALALTAGSLWFAFRDRWRLRWLKRI